MQMTNPHPLADRLDLAPESPGVYLMKDVTGSFIYIGKAVNLRARLRSYFTANPQGNTKVLAMISHIADFSTIVCANELEALILESTLIKKHQPTYNILLRDDKDYPYIRVTMNEPYPRILKAFRIGPDQKDGARYYGPYLAGDVKRALNALRPIFPLKTCRRVLPRDIGKERPCLNYYIGRCIGPCKGDVPAEAYRQVMERICRFFEGKTDSILTDLKEDMADAAQRLAYEEAGRIRDRIRALEKLMEKQQAVDNRPLDRDVLGLAANGSEICLQKLEIRQGRLVASASFFWPEEDLALTDVIQAFIMQHYPATAFIPPEILTPLELAEAADLAAYLSSLRQGRCQIRQPRRGKDVALLEMARNNAEESLRRHTLQGGNKETALQQTIVLLAEVLELPAAPARIEALDISFRDPQDQAAGLVVFQNGRPARSQYRHFRLAGLDKPDDYAAMSQTLQRRLKRLEDESFGSQPDLILADGGLGQVNALKKVLAEQNIQIPLAGIVKDQKHRTRALVRQDGRVIELRSPADQLLLADADNNELDVSDEEKLALLRLLTAIQDEAHRFAGRYMANLHKKRQTKFKLETISGIGPARRKLLLQHFHTIKNISRASLDQLMAVEGLPEKAAQAVYEHFHPEEQEV